jgi:light-regulated signal transduction histidine kinase (bacteriophytochrome)
LLWRDPAFARKLRRGRPAFARRPRRGAGWKIANSLYRKVFYLRVYVQALSRDWTQNPKSSNGPAQVLANSSFLNMAPGMLPLGNGLPMITNSDCIPKVFSQTNASADAITENQAETGQSPSRDQLEKQVAELLAKNAELVLANRKKEEKLQLVASQLERNNHELQDFAYVASHDLQEPLRKIVVFGERLKEKNADKFDTQSKEYLERMQKAGGRMQILINDLLTYSRLTTKAQPFAPVNLAEIAADVAVSLKDQIEMAKARIETGALPVIDAEALQMHLLLQNVIGNALKFRRLEEPPVVKVEAQILPDSAAPEKKLCRLTVSDNGIGFEEKYVDRIFNVFQRLHTRSEYEGTGMGLAVVRKIARYHGGDVTATSKPGEGSTFIVTIPAAHPECVEDTHRVEPQ